MREKFAYRTILQLITYVLTLFAAFVMADRLAVELVGILTLARSVFGIFTLFTSVGFELIYFRHNTDKNFEDYFTGLFFYQSVLMLANMLPLFILLLFVNFGYNDLLFVLLFNSIVSGMSTQFFTLLQSKMKIMKSETFAFIFSNLESIFKILIVLNLWLFTNPLLAILTNTLIFSAFRLIMGIYLNKGHKIFGKLKKDILKSFFKETRPLIYSNLIAVVFTYLGKILLDASYGHEELAYYSFIDNYIITFLLLVSGSIKPLYLSLFSQLFAKNKQNLIQKVVNIIEKYSSIVFIFVIVYVFINGDLLFTLLIPKYLPSVPYLYILIFIPYIAGINRPYSMQLIPGGKQKVSAIYSALKITTLTILTIIIVPKQIFSINLIGAGAIGLGFISLANWIIDLFFYGYFSKRFFNIGTYKKKYLHLLIGLNVFLIAIILKGVIIIYVENIIIIIIIMSLIPSILYLIELWLLKEIKRKDINFIFSFLRLQSYRSSYLEE